MSTRQIVGIMRDIAREYAGTMYENGFVFSVELSRAYGRRRYSLRYQNATRSGILATYDATRHELYLVTPDKVRAASGDIPHVVWDRVARESLSMDWLMSLSPFHAMYSFKAYELDAYRENTWMDNA